MLHPHRSLQDLADGELSDRRRISVEHHVARCAPCSEALGRLRGLKSSLLGLRNPDPDPELRRRLLAQDFAPVRPAGAVRNGASTAPGRPAAALPHRGHRRRPLVVAAGGSAVVAGTLLAGAYVVGAEPAPTADPAGTTAVRAGWDSVAPLTPASLDEDQLETLRAGGWFCPELESLGFTLRSAEGITVAGRPTLELVLEKDGDTVTVYEQRKIGGGRDAGVLLSPITGTPVSSDGFEHMGGNDRDLWLREGDPWQVMLDSPDVTYTVVSDLPASVMPETMSSLVLAERAQLSFGPAEQQDSMLERIVRGLATITTPRDTPD